jgi:hypothetical protein
MPQLSSYPLVTSLANDDLVPVTQDSSGATKNITFENLALSVGVLPINPAFQASQYTLVTHTGNGGGIETASILSGSIRGSLTIPANKLIVGSAFRWKISGILSASGTALSKFYNNLFLGGNLVGGTVFIGTASLQTIPVNSPYVFEGLATISTVGSGGSYYSNNRATVYDRLITYSGTSASQSINTTIDNMIACTVSWEGGTASDTITITNALFEII